MYAIVRYLESERDLSAEELRLTLSIEDPMIAERREQVGCGARSAGDIQRVRLWASVPLSAAPALSEGYEDVESVSVIGQSVEIVYVPCADARLPCAQSNSLASRTRAA